jgi:hypothetical protein
MKYILLVSLFFFVIFVTYSQDVKLGFQTGVGAYNMEGLKKLNSDVAFNLPFNVKIIENYPNYYFYKPKVELSYNAVSFGCSFSYYSTGSRISVKDYTGEYLFDSKIKAWAPGFYGNIRLFPKGKSYSISLYTEIGKTYTTLLLKEYFILDNTEVINTKEFFTSTNYFFEPGIKCSYSYKSLGVELSVGNFMQFGSGKLESTDGLFIINSGKEVKPEWDGFRVGLTLFLISPW